MSIKDDLDILRAPGAEVQSAYDQASTSAGGHAWTLARHCAALSMGCAVMSGVVGPDLDSLAETGSYPNLLRDVIIVSYLCQLSEEGVFAINAKLTITKAIADAFAWAEKEKLVYGSEAFLAGVRNMSSIIANVFKSFYSVDQKRSAPFTKTGARTKQRGKSGSRSQRSKRPVKARRS